MRNFIICNLHKTFCGEQIKETGMDGVFSAYRVDTKCIKMLVGKSEGKRVLGGKWRRLNVNIKWISRK